MMVCDYKYSITYKKFQSRNPSWISKLIPKQTYEKWNKESVKKTLDHILKMSIG